MQEEHGDSETKQANIAPPQVSTCRHPVRQRVPLPGSSWMCDACGEDAPSPEQSREDAERRLGPVAARVEAWLRAHSGEPCPLPAWVQELAESHPESSARALVDLIEARGASIVDGELPTFA